MVGKEQSAGTSTLSRSAFIEVLQKDTAFLARMRLIDYSILVGVHELRDSCLPHRLEQTPGAQLLLWNPPSLQPTATACLFVTIKNVCLSRQTHASCIHGARVLGYFPPSPYPILAPGVTHECSTQPNRRSRSDRHLGCGLLYLPDRHPHFLWLSKELGDFLYGHNFLLSRHLLSTTKVRFCRDELPVSMLIHQPCITKSTIIFWQSLLQKIHEIHRYHFSCEEETAHPWFP